MIGQGTRLHSFVVKHKENGNALRKKCKTLEYFPCFFQHFFRVLIVSWVFTKDQCTVEASLLDK